MSQDVFSLFTVDQKIQQLYLNELKSFAYNSSFLENPDGSESFDEYYYSIHICAAVDVMTQIFAYNSDSTFFEKVSIEDLFPRKLDASDPVYTEYLSDERFCSVFYYSLLGDLMRSFIFAEVADMNMQQLNAKYESNEISDVEYDNATKYFGVLTFLKHQMQGEDLPSIEFLASINYHNNDKIVEFIETHNLSDNVANIIFNFILFELKYLNDNDVTDDDYAAKVEQYLNFLVEFKVDPSVVSFRDLFLSIKFKDIINNYSQKFLKANKKYSNAKLIASILDVDKAFSNMFALSVMALDKINDMSKNAELTKLKDKHHMLHLKVISCFDQEAILKAVSFSFSDELYDSWENIPEMLKLRSKFAVQVLAQCFVSAQKSHYELLKAACTVPNRLSLSKLKSVLTDPIKLEFVLSCYDLSETDPDQLRIKSGLNSSQLRTCNLFIDNAGYFTPTGLVKGFLSKFKS